MVVKRNALPSIAAYDWQNPTRTERCTRRRLHRASQPGWLACRVPVPTDFGAEKPHEKHVQLMLRGTLHLFCSLLLFHSIVLLVLA